MRRLFIMRKDLHMSTGKLLAQTCHCAEAYWTRQFRRENVSVCANGEYAATVFIPKDVYEQYVCDSFTKTVCEAKSKTHLLKAKATADEMGLTENIDYGLIYDKCLTELEPEEQDGTTLTGIWFRPLPDEQAHMISKKYQLYK
ncbi:MAG: aminoacyl-tRNA hydrolase [Eubacteriales bacterium]|nr:aminoacyl-tRNA hydrolase [Eubacteriales bacterium]